MAFTKFKKFYLVPENEIEVSQGNKQSQQPLAENLILTNIPKKFIRNANSILSYIRNKISWSSNGALLDASGTVIPDSHISDLIRYTICPFGKNEPVGLADFRTQLSELNLPSGFVNNPKIVCHNLVSKPGTSDWVVL